MNSVSVERIRKIYSSSANWYEILLRSYRILGVDLGRWRRDAMENLPDISNPRILDVAGGTGANIPFLIDRYPDYEEIILIDYTPQMLARARRRVNERNWRDIRILLLDARNMTERLDGQFDLIVSTYSLSIIPNSIQVLYQMKELLHRTGYLLLLDCQKFKGLLRFYNPLAIFLSTRLGGNNETYSVPVSDTAANIFTPVRRNLMYAGLFYEDLYRL